MKTTIQIDEPQKVEKLKRRKFMTRINLFFFCTFVLFSVLIVRLAMLQFVEGKDLAAKKLSVTERKTLIPPVRGNILDSNGYPVAYTSPTQSLFFRVESPQKKDDVIALAQRLADVFQKYGRKDKKQLTADDIVKTMDVGYDLDKKDTKKPSYNWVPRRIKPDLTKEEIAYFMEHRDEFKWIDVTEESIRTYDPKTIAVQLVGYMKSFSASREPTHGLPFYKDKDNTDNYLDSEDVGYSGLELMYQKELRGETGAKSYPVNASDKIIGKVSISKPQKGNNLQLSINKDIQLVTEKAITDQIEFLHTEEARRISGGYGYAPNARAGYAVAMEVKTGRVVSMASMPDYDPNVWNGGISQDNLNKIQPFVNNGTIRTSYPDWPEKERNKHPSSLVYLGSTIKPLTVLFGLNNKFFNIWDQYSDVGSFKFGLDNSSISNSDRHAWGPITPSQAIEHSSNTFMSAMVGYPLYQRYGAKGMQMWADFLAKFGLGVDTGSGLPGEFFDNAVQNEFFANAKKDSAMSALIYASWGQNERYTPLQLAQYAATLANKGKRMKPQFVDKITTYDGVPVKTLEPVIMDQEQFPEQYWNSIFTGMQKVGKQGFDGFNYSVAAKTGTSTQTVGGKPVDNAVFIAFAPVEDPKLAIAIVIPEGGYGSWGAAPIARKMFDAYDKFYGLGAAPNPAIQISE